MTKDEFITFLFSKKDKNSKKVNLFKINKRLLSSQAKEVNFNIVNSSGR